jgi:hypothetical protein
VIPSVGRQFDRQTIIDAMTNKSVKIITSDTTGNLGANTAERHIFFSPKGTISRIINALVTWKAEPYNGALTGSKNIYFDNYISDTSGLGNMQGTDTDLFNDFVFGTGTFRNGYSLDASKVTFMPNDFSAINHILRELTFDETTGLSIVFQHNMNGYSFGDRHIILFVEQEVVSR